MITRIVPSIALLLGLSSLVASGPVIAAQAGRSERADEHPWRLAPTGGLLTLPSPGPKMILIAASAFTMGSTPDEIVGAIASCGREPYGHRCEESMFSDELPSRRVTLSAYWLDRTEVTVQEYARCVALRRCRPAPFGEGGRRFDRPNYPISMVSWYDAQQFCRFRGGRLPTEAEFERAARGPNGRRYPWGDLYNSHAANHGKFAWNKTDDQDGFPELAPVGSFPDGKTPEGFLDLAGNVSEWVNDRYLQRYIEQDVTDPVGPAPPLAGSVRVVRGGDYESGGPWLRGAQREAAEPETRQPSVGFRCARSARRALVPSATEYD